MTYHSPATLNGTGSRGNS